MRCLATALERPPNGKGQSPFTWSLARGHCNITLQFLGTFHHAVVTLMDNRSLAVHRSLLMLPKYFFAFLKYASSVFMLFMLYNVSR